MLTDYIERTINDILNRTGSRDPEEICETLGILLHYIDMERRIKAYCLFFKNYDHIVIDNNINSFYIKFLLAHELGHVMLHHSNIEAYMFEELKPFDSSSKLEYEANLFAAELLLEDHIVFEKLHTEQRTYYEIAQEMGVPYKPIQIKLIMLKHKGYIMMDLPTTKSEFLKDNMGEYDQEWY